jgi:acyl-CoA dehydrogenase
VIVPLPHPNVVIQRPLSVFGYDHAPFGHGEVRLHHVALTRKEIVPGSGFQVAQARLGPGRIHHCMRAVGTAQRCYDLMVARSCERRTFGRYLYEHGSVQKDLADCYSNLQAARLLTLHCAHRLDMVGPKRARQDISSIKVAVPHLLMQVLDCCVQIHGGAGVSQDTLVAAAWANMRTLRIADGPDEVHRQTVAKLQVRKVKATMRRSRL